MVERRQLPPQIKRVKLAQRDGGRAVIRYQLTVDVGVVDGKRKQLRKRYATEREARAALDAVRGDVAKGTYVHPLTSRWARMLKAAGVRHIRFHDARHTCGTLMHLQDVPIAVISAWLGHASKAFTMAT